MNPEPSPDGRCTGCGTPQHLAGADDLCPGCLLAAALDHGPMEDEPVEEFLLGECGAYDLRKIIGRGGHGVVFLAYRRGSSKPCALKMLASARLAGPDELRRFRLEAEAAQSLEHRHLVKVHEVGEHEGSPYFVMDYAPAGTLAERLDHACEKSALHVNIELIVKVARAVHFAHERGVLHRDLKPANILLDEFGEPLVSDFGLARLLHAPSGVTMTGAALGTPSYMSPEQASGGTVTIAADLFSLGAILFHLLTGRPPFEGDTPLETLRRVTSMDAPDPRGSQPWIDRDLAMVCLTSLRREPSRRYASVAVFADDLERWHRGEPVLARPVPLPERCLKWCRRHPIAATLVLTGSLAFMLLATLFVAGSMLLREERNTAVRQESIASQNAQAAIAARDESQLNSYASDIYLAFRAFDDGHLGLARKMLGRHLPAPGTTDPRGFEWHALSRRCRGDDVSTFQDHSAPVMAVAFDPGGKLLASAGRDGRVMIRSFPDGKPFLLLPKADAPRDAAEIPLMTAITARSAEMKSRVLAGALNPAELRMRGRPSILGEISCIAFSRDGTRFATGGLGSYVRIWSMPGGDLSGLVPVYTANRLEFSADGGRLFVHSLEMAEPRRSELRIYQTSDLALLHVLPALQAAHAISPDGNAIAVIREGETRIRIHDAASMANTNTWDVGIGVKQLAFSPDGKLLYGLETSGTLIASWSFPDGRRTGSVFPVSGRFTRFQPSPDGLHIASTGAGQTIANQSIGGASPAVLLTGHEDVIHAIAWSPDGHWLASAGNDHSCRVWKALPVETKPAMSPAGPEFSDTPPSFIAKDAVWTRGPDCIWAGDGKANGVIHRLPVAGGPADLVLAGPSGRYLRLAASPDGRLLAAFFWPRSIRLMNLDTRTWSRPWKISEGTVGPVVFSPDGRWIASGGDDNEVGIRSTKDGKLLATLRGHQDRIIDLAVSPDGRTLVSSSDDKTLRLWHVRTWRDLGVLHQGETLHHLAFTESGDSLRGLTPDGQLREFGGK